MLKRKRLIIIAGIIFSVVLLLAGFIRRQYVVPIIMYHSVNPEAVYANRLAVTNDTFERQMRFLKRHRYNVIDIPTLADLIRNKDRIPPRTIAITLDDGYRDNYTHAFPILKKYNLPATLFVILNEVGRPEGDRLSWEEIEVMRDSGIITFGSHCLGPEPLVNLASEEEVKKEISLSKRILEERLAKAVTVFSYPEGRFNERIRQLVIDAGYKSAVATNPGKDYPSDDIFALKRMRISENARNLFIFWVETSGFYTFMKEHRHK